MLYYKDTADCIREQIERENLRTYREYKERIRKKEVKQLKQVTQDYRKKWHELLAQIIENAR